MKKALIIALCAGALISSGLSVAKTTSNPFQPTVISSQTQDVAQKVKCKKGSKSKKCVKTSKHHASRTHRHHRS